MTRIQIRRDTSTNWSVNNPTPANGEPCYETDTHKFKIGDGVTKYTNLPYQGGGGGGGATIDDSKTATTSVWSSSKTNTEITTVDSKVVQIQGDVASLDGDVSTLKTDVSTLKTDVSGLKTDVSGLETGKQNTLVAGDNITIDPETNTISATGGGSAPTNMVTTDTAQDITANKTFYGEIRVGADNNYATLAKFSKEALVSGDSTLSEHIDLGEADFVVQGNLGKKVYETDKYVYKKYINVDDLSDNQIKMDNSISSQVAHMAMPSDKYIDLTLGATGATYTAPADGWVTCEIIVQPKGELSINSNLSNSFLRAVCGNTFEADFPVGISIPVVKGGSFMLWYTKFVRLDMFKFIYAVGSQPST